MCGIVGFASPQPTLARPLLEAMSAAVRHRGPDDAGLRLWRGGHPLEDHGQADVGLAQRRLSIIDMSPSGHQPMGNEDGTVWITYNGEFYNFQDYRAELETAGHRFRSHSDTETILHLYEQHGLPGTLKRINGMFAFALWDAHRRTLLLARDRVGKKPLYYLHRPDGTLLFASEIKALLASGLVDRTRLDETALLQFWLYGYAIGERTIYRDIRRLRPGHFATWRDGHLAEQEYWDCPFGLEAEAARPLDDLADELDALLRDAIRLRLISDVPVGLFLSGGVDSSLIAALTARVAGPRLKSYTIGFADEAFDEAPHAAAVARHLGLENVALRVDAPKPEEIAAIARHFDEPFGDSSAVPTWQVAQLARRHVTVALTGDAGDELFAGYSSYADGLRLWGSRAQRRLFARPRHGLEHLWDARLRLLGPRERLNAWERVASGRVRKRLFSPALLARMAELKPYHERERWYARVAGADLLSQMQYVNLKTYLPDDILVKVDRASMAHALECRSPLLDHRIIEFASRLPYNAKIDERGGRKRLLRHLLARHVPPALFERPKQGFAVPWSRWCQGTFREDLLRRWQTLAPPGMAPGAGAWLLGDPVPSSALAWNAFSLLQFLEDSAAR
jgi:asparagine synthase (glutamine-hydrolysing)